jgi:hypothetical protein
MATLDHVLYYRRGKQWNVKLHQARDQLFTILFPLTIYVCIGFYSAVLNFGRGWYRLMVDNYDHGAVAIIMIIELLAVHHEYPSDVRGHLKNVAIIFGASAAYVGWNLICRYESGVWPYAFQGKIPMWERFIIYPLMSAFFISLYFVGYKVDARVHGTRVPSRSREGFNAALIRDEDDLESAY